MTGIPYHQLGLSAYGAVRFIESYEMTDVHNDWSKVRSPSRTRRRMKRGIPNRNIRLVFLPKTEVFYIRETNTIVGHPETLRALRRKLEMSNRMDKLRMAGLLGIGLAGLY